jgi:hypothetical protein
MTTNTVTISSPISVILKGVATSTTSFNLATAGSITLYAPLTNQYLEI